MARKASSQPADSTATIGFEAKLWLTADKHRTIRSHQKVSMNPLVHRSGTLATLRDTLLPKLLGGELSLAAVNSSEFPDSSNQGNRKP